LLTQIKISFSTVQRNLLTPNDFVDFSALATAGWPQTPA
jgi:hypothetical protein